VTVRPPGARTIDEILVASDGNFPFEHRFITPAITPQKVNFTLRARAIDTGGNATWSDVLTVKLLPDVIANQPPTVIFTTPAGGGAKTLTSLQAYFNKPVDPATLTPASFKVFAAGPDGRSGTADDVLVGSSGVSYSSLGNRATLTFATALPIAHYRAVITSAVADPSGQHLTTDYTWEFEVADATFWVNFGDGAWDIAANGAFTQTIWIE